MDENRWRARVFLGIALSVLAHVCFSWLAWFTAGPIPMSQDRMALIEWIEPSSLDSKSWLRPENQIVRKVDVAKNQLTDDQVKPKRRFLSEDDQTVIRESKAALSGLTENRMGIVPEERSANPERRQHRPELGVKPEPPFSGVAGDIAVKLGGENMNQELGNSTEESQELALPFDPRLPGMSTNGEQLPPDIEIGSFTALNTDRFRYYTFYSRIEEQIRHRWVKYVKATLYSGRFANTARSFTTKLEVVLDRRGDFIRAIIHDESGSNSIDAAPVLAFREAKRIPHPPREMVQTDGTIRLFYAFHVDQLPSSGRSARHSAEPNAPEDTQ